MKSCYDQWKLWNNDEDRDPNSIFAKVVYSSITYNSKIQAPIKLVVEGEICPPGSVKIGEGKKGGVYLPYTKDDGPPYKIYSDCEAQLVTVVSSNDDYQ